LLSHHGGPFRPCRATRWLFIVSLNLEGQWIPLRLYSTNGARRTRPSLFCPGRQPRKPGTRSQRHCLTRRRYRLSTLPPKKPAPPPGPRGFTTDALRRGRGLEPPQAPSPTTFALMNELDALAEDLAMRSRASTDQRSEPDQGSEAENSDERKEKEEEDRT